MNIAIWGLGVSGLATLKYLTKKNEDQIFLINQGAPETWKEWETISKLIGPEFCFSQSEAGELSEKIDLIILSPGIDPRISELRAFKDVQKICDVEYMFKDCDLPIIAVTGTNGKTTTVTIIAEALKKYGKKVFLGGNIGIPACDFGLSEESFDVVVLELSSFQIELLREFHPQIAVILNIDKSHMERYDSVQDYVEAKLLLTKNLIEKDLFLSPKEFLGKAHLAKTIEITPSETLDFSQMKCIGEHYKSVYFIVENILSYLGISNLSPLQELVNEFPGVEYRIEFIKNHQGMQIYNDGKSTNTASTLTALKQFPSKRVALLLGGKLRDESQSLVELRDDEFNIDFFSFGEAGSYIQKQVGGLVFKDLRNCLVEVIQGDYDVLLFSPAFPSFDQYKNYIERCEHFNLLIKELTV